MIMLSSKNLIKFIKIYRRHECLWDTENVNYNNCNARNIALAAFSDEFGFEDLGPKKIARKIRNLRTLYFGERKKINDLMQTGSGTATYKCKLFWYPLMDSFLRKSFEYVETISNMNDTSFVSQDNNTECIGIKKSIKHLTNATTQAPEAITKPRTKGRQKNKPHNKSARKLDNIEKRERLEKEEGDMDYFAKYVASSLRTLSAVNSVQAQDEIQSVLSKYKLWNLRDKVTSTPMPELRKEKQAAPTTRNTTSETRASLAS